MTDSQTVAEMMGIMELLNEIVVFGVKKEAVSRECTANGLLLT